MRRADRGGVVKVFITKYWETKGIIEADGETYQGQPHTDGSRTEYFNVKHAIGLVRVGVDGFITRAAANQRVKEQAAKRVKALKKKLKHVAVIAAHGFPEAHEAHEAHEAPEAPEPGKAAS
jgi:hypothetical protein